MGVLIKENGLSTKKATSRKSVFSVFNGTIMSSKFKFLQGFPYFAVKPFVRAIFSWPFLGQFEN